eukprot:gnl/TRDRNA2_/TRDRNA2_150896_c0_seq3.p1 gnl/TRDRNA2_/TRDRNA2_150896_c0~~gnl/TRDRNA2_/TRDRNA2_150896_c0_seq3.p1  ORF type:complete len:231 (+),score=46.32 gnl/TRDRNA2_/TRDRNA2_150896_c0_seq3:52-744(+)
MAEPDAEALEADRRMSELLGGSGKPPPPPGLPWAAQTLGSVLAFSGAGEADEVVLDTAHIDEALPASLKFVLLYFSGRWCPLCQEFDTIVRDVYASLKALPEGHDLELVWVSCDVSEAAYKEHLGALGNVFAVEWSPFRLDEIVRHFDVTGIPALLVLDAAKGRLLTADGREDIYARAQRQATASPRGRSSLVFDGAKLGRAGVAALHEEWCDRLKGKRAEWDAQAGPGL